MQSGTTFHITHMKTNPNDPAQPVRFENTPHGLSHIGLTKREYFAALALQGLSADPDWSTEAEEVIAKEAVQRADALIDELNMRPVR